MRSTFIAFLLLPLFLASGAFADCSSQPWTFANGYVTTNCGRVGVGTSTPANRLHLYSTVVADGVSIDGTNSPAMSLRNAGVVKGYVGVATEGSAYFTTAQANDIVVRSETGRVLIGQGSLLPAMTVSGTNGGDVVIGHTLNDPTTRLTVHGSAVINGNIAAKFQDLAEWVPATTEMEPGTVVVLNSEKTNEVMPSSEAYDTAVAGVVSAQPGIILGEASASKAMIATTGRVKVRVDATEAPIRTGDLLVTSDRPGTAMRSKPLAVAGAKIHRPGTVIGKALEPLKSGTGEILVLLSLQ